MNLRNRNVPKVTKYSTDQASSSGSKAAEPKNTVDAKGKGEMKDKPQNKTSDKK